MNSLRRYLLPGCVALAAFGLTFSFKPVPVKRDLVAKELRWLKQDPSGKGVVVFEEYATKKFLQFSGRKLFVYLPHQTLSTEEMERATITMGRLGVKKEVYPIGEGSSRYVQTAFQKDLGGDNMAAFKIAEAVFREVYRFPPEAKIGAKRSD